MSKSNVKLKITKERLQKYYDCEEKILQGQSYTIGSRSLTRANLAEVQDMIAKLEADVEALETRGTTKRPVRRGVPVDR